MKAEQCLTGWTNTNSIFYSTDCYVNIKFQNGRDLCSKKCTKNAKMVKGKDVPSEKNLKDFTF